MWRLIGDKSKIHEESYRFYFYLILFAYHLHPMLGYACTHAESTDLNETCRGSRVKLESSHAVENCSQWSVEQLDPCEKNRTGPRGAPNMTGRGRFSFDQE